MNESPFTVSGSAGAGHALVVGGGIGGLLAARVLAGHFDRVTVVERDPLPDHPVERRGTPQARHQHVMMQRGRVVLETLFPGLGDELVAAGAPEIDMAEEVAWLTPAGWGVRFPSRLRMLSSSRDLLEWVVRRRLRGDKRVRFLAPCDVTGLVVDEGLAGGARPSRGPIRGARLRTGGAESTCPAALVVDASGRGSHAPGWLEALGFPAPPEEVVDAGLAYASRLFEGPGRLPAGCRGAYVQAAPPGSRRGGVCLPIEGDRLLVTLTGGGGERPPADEEGFLDYARGMRDPVLYDAIKDCRPLSPVYATRSTRNLRRRYERLPRRPEGLLVLGDAACAFNPVYAQGMTVAALGAATLEACLGEARQGRGDGGSGWRGERARQGRGGGDLTGLAGRFQRRLAAVQDVPWTLATGEDFRYPGAAGRRPLGSGLLQRYVDEVVALTTEVAGVRQTLLETFQMLRPPAALFHPAIAFRVLGRAAARALPRPGRSDRREAPATARPYPARAE